MLKSMAGLQRAVCRMAATRCRSRLQPAWGSEARVYPDLFQPYAGFPTVSKSTTATSCCPSFLASVLRGKSDLYREMRALAS